MKYLNYILLFFFVTVFSFCKERTGNAALKIQSTLEEEKIAESDSLINEKYPPHFLGDTIKIDSQIILIQKCIDDFKRNDPWNLPEGYLKTVFVKVLYKNTHIEKTLKIEPQSWTLVDPTGARYNTSSNLPKKYSELKEQSLKPNQVVIGWLAFKTPYFQNSFDALLDLNNEDEKQLLIRIEVKDNYLKRLQQ